MTNTELADEIERSLDVLQPLSHGDTLFSAPNAAPGCELRFSTLRQIIAALRRQPGPSCEDCGFEMVKGELDRGGQEWWCPVCAKAGMRMAENKRLRKELAERQPSSNQVLVPRELLEWIAHQKLENDQGHDAYVAMEAVALAQRLLAAAERNQ